MKNVLKFFASSSLTLANVLNSTANSFVNISNSLTPSGLTDEHWNTLDSIKQWNWSGEKFYYGISNCVTRYYHLEGEQLDKFQGFLDLTGNETQAMQMLFRNEYEESHSYTFDKLIQLPAHLFQFGSYVAKASSYVPYTIGKGFEILSDLEFFNSSSKEADMVYAQPYEMHDVELTLPVADFAVIGLASALIVSI